MITPTRIVRMIGIAGLVGWMGMVGWVARTTQAQNGGQDPAPLPQTATKPESLPEAGPEIPKAQTKNVREPLPAAPDSGASPASDASPNPPPPLPAAGTHLAEPSELPSPPPVMRDLAATQQPSSASEPAGPRTLAGSQPVPSSIDEPEQSAQSFVERNQKEAEDHLRALTAEAQQLRARLAKLESGIKKWQGLVNALKSSQGQPTTSTAVAPGAEDAGDLEPIKPSQAGGARVDKHVKWATATSAATGASAQPGENVEPAHQFPAAQPPQVVVPGSVPR